MKHAGFLILFWGATSLAFAQAPDSIAGFTYREDTSWVSIRDGIVDSLDFQSDGTYNTRLLMHVDYVNEITKYTTPLSGSFTYTKIATNQAAIVLTPSTGSADQLTLNFSDSTGGNVSRNAQGATTSNSYIGRFSLLPTGGSGTTRGLVNISALISVKQGTPATIGFVVGGTQLREFLIRAVGPTLSSFGVGGVSENPVYTLREVSGNFSSELSYPPPGEHGIFGNHLPVSWSASSAGTSTIAAESNRVGAFALAQGSNDKADVFLLYPGAYTIVVNPPDSSSEGAELIEVYEVP